MAARRGQIEHHRFPARFAFGEDTDPSGADDGRPPRPRCEKLVTSNLTKSWLGRLQGMTGTQQFEAIVSAHGGAAPRRPPGVPAVRDSMEGSSPMNTDDVSRDLARAFPAAPGDLSSAARPAGRRFPPRQHLDVAYRIVDSPVGPLLLAATEQGLVRVAYAREDHDAVLQALANKVSPRILHAPARLDLAARELEEYFAGRRRAFDLPLDWRLSVGFRRTVLGGTTLGSAMAIPPAMPPLLSWPEIRRRSAPSAVPARPTLMPVVVPCHRVVRSDGSIGGYLGGADAKRTLLTLEAASFPPAARSRAGGREHGSAPPTGTACAPTLILSRSQAAGRIRC